MRPLLLLIPVVFLISAGNSWGGGSVSGIVTYQGIPPSGMKKSVGLDVETCGKQVPSEDLVIGKKGGIKNVVVFLKGPVAGARGFSGPEGGFVIDQKNCRFEPHVVIVPAGKSLEVLNSDGILHNFHTYSLSNRPINRAQPSSLPKMTLSFDRPEIFEVRCDVHDWMRAWIVVAEHPYYVLTDEEGRFQLTDVPAGDYTLSLWHEALGRQSRRIVVREGEGARGDFKLTRSATLTIP